MKTSVRVCECVHNILIHTSVFIRQAERRRGPSREQHASGIIDKANTRVFHTHTHTKLIYTYTKRIPIQVKRCW